MHIWQKTLDLITALSPISNITDSGKKGTQPVAFNFIHDVFPRASSPFCSCRPIFFLSRLVASRTFLALAISFVSSFLNFFPVRYVSLDFLSYPFLPFPYSFRRCHLPARSLSLFHFSIVEGKITYLSAAFLLPPLLSAATCWLYIALQPATKTSWQVFARFTGGIRLALQTLPENYAAVASWYICSRL